MVHDIAVVFMTDVVVIRIVPATLLTQVGQQEIGKTLIHVFSDPEDRRLDAAGDDIVASRRLQGAHIKSPGTLERPFGRVGGLALSAEDLGIGHGITDDEIAAGLRGGNQDGNLDVVREITGLVDTHPGLRRQRPYGGYQQE